VPGKNPAEAVREYIHPLQQSLSCFSRAVLRPSGYDTDRLLGVTFGSPTVELMTQRGEILRLSFVQEFSIIKALWLGAYKVRTHSYYYGLEDEHHAEIIAFHWHPDTTPQITFPHMHICAGAGDRIRPEIRGTHFPTSRISFEEFCLLLLREFHVVAERSDSERVLEENFLKFKNHRTW